MAYFVSIIPKFSVWSTNELSAKKVSAIKRVLRKRKNVVLEGGELTVGNYKTRAAAYTAAATVRNRIHGATAKVYPVGYND